MTEWIEVKHFGKVKLSLNGRKALKFGDPEYNKKESSNFFNEDTKKNKLLFRLHFEKISKQHKDRNFYIYFVDQKKIEDINKGFGFSGDKDFRIRLEKDNEYLFWLAVKNDSDNKSDTIDNFVNKHWVAAQSIILICSDENTPLISIDGLPLHYNIQFEYKGFYNNLFEYIKNDLKPKSYENITSYFKNFEKIVEYASETYTKKERMLFYRINDFIVPFIELSKSIVSDPYEHVEMDIVQKSIIDIDFSHTQLNSYNIVSFSQSGVLYGKRILPNEITYHELHKSELSKENIFVKNGLFIIQKKIDQVICSLKTYILELDQIVTESRKRNNDYNYEIINGNKKNKEEHERVINYLEGFYLEISDLIINFLPDSPIINEDISIQNFSEIISYDPRYSLFNQYLLLFTILLEYIDDTNDIHAFNIIPFNQMYELWVFLFFVSVLKDLGFSVQNEDETLSFYNNPKPNYCYNLIHEKISNKEFKLFFNRIFPKQIKNKGNIKVTFGLADRKNANSYYEELKRTGLGEDKAKFSPDICLEIWDLEHQCHPEIFILDPTLAQTDSILKSKHEYSKSIRCFNCTETIGDKVEGRRIVSSAWAVYPDNPNYNNIEKMENSNTNGYVKLNHKSESQTCFRDLIIEILNNNFNIKL
ncbi:MAG: hypothetical protein WAR79_04030 [Melioribacteraceae bacterium]